jgi:hypothetical protein
MKRQIEIKSLVIGLLIGVGALLCIAAEATHSGGGRFQLLATDGFLFKIDTTTGQVWKTDVSRPDSSFIKANLGN